jgi:hypothetical protein
MTPSIDAARDGLADWTAEYDELYLALVDSLEAPAAAREDPLHLIPSLVTLAREIAADEASMTHDDWIAVMNNFVAFLARFMIVTYGARWDVEPAPSSPAGYWYVLRVADYEGVNGWVDPFGVANREVRRRPIEPVRMLAEVETTAGVVVVPPGA